MALNNLLGPNVLAEEIEENLESALGVSGGVEEVKEVVIKFLIIKL